MIVRKNRRSWKRCVPPACWFGRFWTRLKNMVAEGVTTYDLEVAAEKMMADAGARPAFKGYSTPAAGTQVSLCVVHVGE